MVTRDRAGLLARTSGTLTAAGLSIVDAAVTVLPRSGLAPQRLTVAAAPGDASVDWDAAWFEVNGCNVEACRAGADGDRARDVFIVHGQVDTGALAAALGGPDAGSIVTRVVTTPWQVAVGVTASVIRVGQKVLTTATEIARLPFPRSSS